jgi:hypothetical protein
LPIVQNKDLLVIKVETTTKNKKKKLARKFIYFVTVASNGRKKTILMGDPRKPLIYMYGSFTKLEEHLNQYRDNK